MTITDYRPYRLGIDPGGRLHGKAHILYNDTGGETASGLHIAGFRDRFPCINGSFGSGQMDGVVMHTMDGELTGTVDLFNRDGFEASAHFGIAQDGTIWQFGPIGKGWIAWHAVQANLRWYGIEHADDGHTENPLTGPQLFASAQLVEFLSRYAGFPLQVSDHPSIRGYGTHNMGGLAWNPDRHTCPGPGPRAHQRHNIIGGALMIRGAE